MSVITDPVLRHSVDRVVVKGGVGSVGAIEDPGVAVAKAHLETHIKHFQSTKAECNFLLNQAGQRD